MKKFNVYARLFTGRLKTYDAPILAFEDVKVAYIPVPKCANTSIRSALMLSFRGCDSDCIHDFTKNLLVPSSEFFKIPRDDWFVFTVVRDPGNRIHSAWKNKLLERKSIFKPLIRMGITERLSFLDFLKEIKNWPKLALNDHFMSQTAYLKIPIENMNLKIFKFEELDTAWPEIITTLERKTEVRVVPLAHKNKSTTQFHNPFSDSETNLIRDIYEADGVQFGYDLTKN